jgi:RNA polymerase sigma-70 factor, ECF subfamily
MSQVAAGALSDEEVVQRVLAGETALYEIVMRRYNQRLYRVARSIVRDPDEAEDVIQESYVKAYVHLGQFAGEAKFSTWLTRIAVHEALARMNRKKRMVPVADGDEVGYRLDEVHSSEPDPEVRTSEAEAREMLETAIEALPAGYRSVFVMREVEGLSTAETARCLDLNEENVKVRLHRSRRMLRDALYQRAQVASASAFQFLGPRCDAIVAAVMRRVTHTERGPSA